MTATQLGAAATLLAVLSPLLLAAAIWVPGLRRSAMAGAPWAAVPALVLAVALHGRADLTWSWALLGVRLGSGDAVGRAFLLFTACLWLAAGLFARSYLASDPSRARFWSYFLATSGGNFGLILAQDVASFYAFYALATFAMYGLVVHERTEEARRAARVYLVLALAGEMLLWAAFLLVVGVEINLALPEVPRAVARSAHRDLLVGLLLAGFGIKAGALGLHMWLPLAHPVAPTPASAVLSGALIKAGLLGWLRFLPLGVAPLPALGLACVIAGVAAALFGNAIGVTQRDPKTILAYSSVSQMGFMTAALGAGLSSPAIAPAAITAIVFYATHHALAKGMLFLGTGVASATGAGWPGRLVALGLVWPALDLAGAPLSSGALAKSSLEDVMTQASRAPEAPGGSTALHWLLSLAAASSTVLMVHFLWRTIPRSGSRRVPAAGLWAPWLLLLVFDIAVFARPPAPTQDLQILVHPEKLWAAAWPVLAGIAAAGALGWLRNRSKHLRAEIPPGDVLCAIDAVVTRLARAVRAARTAWTGEPFRRWRARLDRIERLPGRVLAAAGPAEQALAAFGTIGLVFIVLVVLAVAAQRFAM